MSATRRLSPNLIERAARVVLDRAPQLPNGTHGANDTNAERTDTTRRVVLRCASDVRVRPVPFLWRPYLPANRLVVFDGPPDVAKSLVSCDWAARVTTGAPFPFCEERREPGVVVIVSAEDDDADTIVPRLIAAGADLDRARLWSAVHIGNDDAGDPLFTIGTDCDALTTALLEVGASLLIVDPLAACLDSSVNTSRDAHVRRELAKLHRLSTTAKVTTVAIRHITKTAGLGSAMNAGGGSIGIIGAARVGLLAVRDKDDRTRRHLAVVKANIVGDTERPTLSYTVNAVPVEGAGEQPRVEWLGTSQATADDLMASFGERPEEAEDRRSADDWLRTYLPGEPKPATDVYRDGANAGGWNQKQLWRALKRIGGRSERHGYGKDGRFCWTIADSAPLIDSIDSGGMDGINDGPADVDEAI